MQGLGTVIKRRLGQTVDFFGEMCFFCVSVFFPFVEISEETVPLNEDGKKQEIAQMLKILDTLGL